MPSLFAKLNHAGRDPIVVLSAPDGFEAALAELGTTRVLTSLRGLKAVSFLLAFVTRQAQIDALAPRVAAAATGDAVVWFAYPKGSSRRYTCNFNRDTGWAALGAHGFEGVRQVAIDEDWSALRFRRVEFIRSMTRNASRAMSAAGKQRTAPKRRSPRRGEGV